MKLWKDRATVTETTTGQALKGTGRVPEREQTNGPGQAMQSIGRVPWILGQCRALVPASAGGYEPSTAMGAV